ncbi:MAG: hypothetical protein CTY34_10165 [Methylobacter sp.]|nr:MAG: hypothetical protein CTY34_10165 [Methylobacter sp.]PPD17412.1 MAG: hypothetical protein CTY24_14955 [Methylobacter sp.]PPD36098.1 MAG: hypothetical protein CTY18_05415 [Methylomonas sp.]
MAHQNIQQWQDQYNQLRQNYINLTGAIDDFKSVYGEDTKSPAFFEAQRLQLRLEYQINQHIDAAVEAGGNALYEECRRMMTWTPLRLV